MSPSNFYDQIPAALLQGLAHAVAILLGAIGQLWTQHPIIGTAFGVLVVAGIALPQRKRRRRSW